MGINTKNHPIANFIGGLIGYGLRVVYSKKVSGLIFTVILVIVNILGAVSGMFGTTFVTSIFLSIPVLIVFAIIHKIKYLPYQRKEEEYHSIFMEIGFADASGAYPVYLCEEESTYLKTVTFLSRIPLSGWEHMQPVLEKFFFKKIANISISPKSNTIVYVNLVIRELPETAYWNDRYIFDDELQNRNIVALGLNYEGIVTMDFTQTPHTFVAGETGSGKSNILKCMIYQCLVKGHEVKLIDFKRGVSFSAFDEYVETYADYEPILTVLQELVRETNQRLDLLRENRVEDMEHYNEIATGDSKLKRIVVFIDELAELMRSGARQENKEMINCLETLTRLSRATGINLVMGIQRPDATIINGQIKNNVSMRICGRFVDPEPSRIMLGNDRATQLPQVKGRFLIKDGNCKEFQAFYIFDTTMTCTSTIKKRAKQDTIPKAPEEPQKVDFNFDDINI